MDNRTKNPVEWPKNTVEVEKMAELSAKEWALVLEGLQTAQSESTNTEREKEIENLIAKIQKQVPDLTT